MKGQRFTIVFASLLLCSAAAHAQQKPHPQQRSSLPAARLFTDPVSAQHWWFTPDPEHPGAPWRAVIETGCVSCGQRQPQQPPLVHAGEPVIVWRSGAGGKFRLRGVALDAAPQGGDLRVRLASGTAVAGVVSARGEVRFESMIRSLGWGTDEP